VVRELGEEYGVELPIVREVDAVINEGRTAEEAYAGLLNRTAQTEFEGVGVT
jgi:glycerol-3-phosphate dehydrogenase (NAD(P)+)